VYDEQEETRSNNGGRRLWNAVIIEEQGSRMLLSRAYKMGRAHLRNTHKEQPHTRSQNTHQPAASFCVNFLLSSSSTTTTCSKKIVY
jgi:hypothetical protein